MKDLVEKYYIFTLTFIVLAASLFIFKDNKDIINIIIGAMVGLIAAPTITSQSTSKNIGTTSGYCSIKALNDIKEEPQPNVIAQTNDTTTTPETEEKAQ